MSEKRRAPRRVVTEEVAMQIAPMVDVTMLLLFFFMLTGKITQGQKLPQISLPKAYAGQVPKDFSGRDFVNINEKGEIYASERMMTMKELKAYLKLRFTDYPPLKLYIRADAKTPGKLIKDVMRIASEVGAIEVIFGTLQTKE
jgi:biopolymer transport protein ExbD